MALKCEEIGLLKHFLRWHVTEALHRACSKAFSFLQVVTVSYQIWGICFHRVLYVWSNDGPTQRDNGYFGQHGKQTTDH